MGWVQLLELVESLGHLLQLSLASLHLTQQVTKLELILNQRGSVNICAGDQGSHYNDR